MVELLAPLGDVRIYEVVDDAGAVREEHLERNVAVGRLKQWGFAIIGKASDHLLGSEFGSDRG